MFEDIKTEYALVDIGKDATDAVKLVCLEMRHKYLLAEQPQNKDAIDELYEKAVEAIHKRQQKEALERAKFAPVPVPDTQHSSYDDSIFSTGTGVWGTR